MKIRYGYVSNSSSSSFVLVFDKMPEDVEELMGMLNFEDISREHTREEYALRVFEDIQEEASDEDISRLVADEVYWKIREDYHKLWSEKDPIKKEKMVKALEEKRNKLEKIELEKFREKYAGKVIRIVRYSDNDGDMDCELEHGGIFDKIEHIYINEH